MEGSTLLGRFLHFGLHLIEQVLADRIDHRLDRRLRLLTHALDFLGTDLVDLHATFLQRRQRLTGLATGVLALGIAGLFRSVHEDALLGRGQPVPQRLDTVTIQGL